MTTELDPSEIMAQWRPVSNRTWLDEAREYQQEKCQHCGAIGSYQKNIVHEMQLRGWFGEPVLLADDGYVWDGHRRLLAAWALGFDRVPVYKEEDNVGKPDRFHRWRSWWRSRPRREMDI